MPELPEVETTVRSLQKKVLNRTFLDVWTDAPKLIKIPKNFTEFKKVVIGTKIKKIWRRGKNILFELSGDKILLVHQKMTGHLLVGKWVSKNGKWEPIEKGPLNDPMNRFLHLVFFLDNREMLSLSDLRKFAKIVLISKKDFGNFNDIKKIGPEPLDKNFSFKIFKERILKHNGKIKQVLMDQEIVAGIGNIYSDEILWESKIAPFKLTHDLNEKDLNKIFIAIKKILKKGISAKGESFSDYRMPDGRRGGFDKFRMVYKRKGEKCPRCGGIIKREKIGGRSAHFCPACQTNNNGKNVKNTFK